LICCIFQGESGVASNQLQQSRTTLSFPNFSCRLLGVDSGAGAAFDSGKQPGKTPEGKQGKWQ